MFQKFLQGHRPQSSAQGRRRVTMDFIGVTFKISKCSFHHGFSWSIYFWIYLKIWDRMSRNQDNAICWFWLTTKLGFQCRNWTNPKSQNWFFLMCSACLIELKTSNRFEFRWVKLISTAFEASPSASDHERWRVTRR